MFIEDFFNRTLLKWDTTPIDLEVNSGSEPFNDKYYTVPKTNRVAFFKEIQRLVEIGVSTPIQKSQYGKPLFIIPKNKYTMRFITHYQKLNHNIG